MNKFLDSVIHIAIGLILGIARGGAGIFLLFIAVQIFAE